MPSKVPEFSAMQVKRLANKPGFHAVGGVAGLYLNVSDTRAASWIFKKVVGTRRQEMGLGGYPDVTLARAREKARDYAELIAQGINPLDQKRAAKSALIRSQATSVTFRQVADRYIVKKSKEFKTAKQVQKLTAHLQTYVYPFIGNMVVGDIERANIVRMLQPIWETKTETASRVRANVERILDLAGAEGLRRGDNPARWKGNLELSLPNPGKVTKVVHYKALPYSDMPQFMRELAPKETTGAKALQFLILTAARSGEVRGATWEEINLRSKVWTIPAERMKGGKQHTVPLSPAAVELLKSLPRDYDHVFPAVRGGTLSDMTLAKVPKSLGHDVTAHGFRSTFRTWAQERTNYPEEVCELALAHINSDGTRAAYARSELIDKRRLLMADWERFCFKGAPKGDVVRMLRRKA
jgi:integrase